MSKIKKGRRVATLVSLMTIKELDVKLNYTAAHPNLHSKRRTPGMPKIMKLHGSKKSYYKK